MTELFSKSFWQGVKKTFHEALEEAPPAGSALQSPAEGDRNAASTSATPSSPSVPGGTSETTL